MCKLDKDGTDLSNSFLCDLDKNPSCFPCAAELSETSMKTISDIEQLSLSCKQLTAGQRKAHTS